MIKSLWEKLRAWVVANPIKASLAGVMLLVGLGLLCFGLWKWAVLLFGGGASVAGKDVLKRAITREQETAKTIETLDQKTRRAVSTANKQALKEAVEAAIELKEAAQKAHKEAEGKSNDQLKRESLEGWD